MLPRFSDAGKMIRQLQAKDTTFCQRRKGAAAECRRHLRITAEQAVAQQVLSVQADHPLTVVEVRVHPGRQPFLVPVGMRMFW